MHFHKKILHYFKFVLILDLLLALMRAGIAALSERELVKETWLLYLFSQLQSNSFS